MTTDISRNGELETQENGYDDENLQTGIVNKKLSKSGKGSK